jgi:hypothetical protein
VGEPEADNRSDDAGALETVETLDTVEIATVFDSTRTSVAPGKRKTAILIYQECD